MSFIFIYSNKLRSSNFGGEHFLSRKRNHGRALIGGSHFVEVSTPWEEQAFLHVNNVLKGWDGLAATDGGGVGVEGRL